MSDSGQPRTVGWSGMNDDAAGRLHRTTGADVGEWLERIREAAPQSEPELRRWLDAKDVGGYSQDLLVHEMFGYPEFMLADADELIDAQYADRESLRPVCDAVLLAAGSVGDVVVQARKTYISLVSPRRSFAIVKASTRNRVDLGLHLPDRRSGGRLLDIKPLSKGTVRVPLASVDDVDDEICSLLRESYERNR